MTLAKNLIVPTAFAQTMPTMPRGKPQPSKPLNANISPRLREFVDAFVNANDRKSAVAVVEEALREFFERRGYKVDADPEVVLRELLESRKK